MKTSKPKRYFLLILLLCAITTAFVSCLKDDDPIKLRPSLKPAFEEKTVPGKLTPVEGSQVDVTELRVISFADNEYVGVDSTFTINIVDSDNYQVVLFRKDGTDHVVYLGLYDPHLNTITANDTTTALGLALLNPFLIHAGKNKIEAFINEALELENEEQLKHEQLADLIANINDKHKDNPDELLNSVANPEIFNFAAELTKQISEELGIGNNGDDNDQKDQNGSNDTIPDYPFIENSINDRYIFLKNPNHIYYAFEVRDRNDSLTGIGKLQPSEFIHHNWGWPPDVETGIYDLPFNLGYGRFNVVFDNGFNDLPNHGNTSTAFVQDMNNDFVQYSNNPPISPTIQLATTLNTAQAFSLLIDLGVGKIPDIDHESLTINTGSPEFKNIFNDSFAEEGDVHKLVGAFCEVFGDEDNRLARWVWHNKVGETTVIDAASFYIKTMFTNIIPNIVHALDEEDVDILFFYDLRHKAGRKEYTFVKVEGDDLDFLNK